MKTLKVIEIDALVQIPAMNLKGRVTEITIQQHSGKMYPIYLVRIEVLNRIIHTKFREFELKQLKG